MLHIVARSDKSAPSRVAFAFGDPLLVSVMTSKRGCCGCCSRRALIIAFAVSGVVLLVAGLVLSVGGVFSNIIKDKVDQASCCCFCTIFGKDWV